MALESASGLIKPYASPLTPKRQDLLPQDNPSKYISNTNHEVHGELLPRETDDDNNNDGVEGNVPRETDDDDNVDK